MAEPRFQRVLLKLSGESLMGDLDYGTDPDRIQAVAGQIAHVHERGVEIAIVVGAGNIYRGMAGAALGMDRATADYMGMLATVLNALPLQDALGVGAVLQRSHEGLAGQLEQDSCEARLGHAGDAIPPRRSERSGG